MIQSRADLRRYLKADGKYGKEHGLFVKWITCSDDFWPICVARNLRKHEYYLNQKRTIFNLIPHLWYWWNFRRLRSKSGIMLFPNTIGEGLNIVHPGFRRIDKFVRIGRNCTILPNVLFGKKHPGIEGLITVGDNCYISTGVTILGPVTIGNNVTIGAGAVVTKDIPDNVVVAGVPAKIISDKTKE